MTHSWVVSDEYPGGHLVPMSPADLAQLERDQCAGAEAAAVQARREDDAAARVADLRRARVELATGVIFSSLSESERTVLDMLLAESAP